MAVEGSGATLSAAMLGGLGGAGEADQDDEEQRDFDDPLCTLVKNCNVLHNIVGPACIFLRQGFAQSQIVCITHAHTEAHAFHICLIFAASIKR